MFLVDAEDDRLCKSVSALHKVGEVLSYRLRSGSKHNDSLEVSGLILLVGDLAAIAIHLALARSPAGRIDICYNAMHTIRSEEAVFNSLLETVGVDRVAEVAVGITVVFAQRCGGHAELVRRFEVLEDLTPVALVTRASAVALINDDEVEEVGRKAFVQAWSAFVFCDRLVDCEVHLSALADAPTLNLEACITEGRERLVLRIVDEDIAIGKKEDARFAVLAGAVPPSAPELPRDLIRYDRLARAGRHGEQHPRSSLKDRLHCSVDRELLVVARYGRRHEVRCTEEPLSLVVGETLATPQPHPERIGRWKRRKSLLLSGRVIELDDLASVRRVCELEPEDLCVLFRLLES